MDISDKIFNNLSNVLLHNPKTDDDVNCKDCRCWDRPQDCINCEDFNKYIPKVGK